MTIDKQRLSLDVLRWALLGLGIQKNRFNRTATYGDHKMDLNTAAAVISYISKIEQESASFYEKWALSHQSLKQAFSSFVEGNKKHEKNLKLTYYSVISDALETGFCFKGLTAEVSVPLLDNDASLHDILAASIEIETKIQKFYIKAAEISKSLLADVPRAMERVAKDRHKRKIKLRLLLEEIES